MSLPLTLLGKTMALIAAEATGAGDRLHAGVAEIVLTIIFQVTVKMPEAFHCSVSVFPSVVVTSAGVVSSRIDAISGST